MRDLLCFLKQGTVRTTICRPLATAAPLPSILILMLIILLCVVYNPLKEVVQGGELLLELLSHDLLRLHTNDVVGSLAQVVFAHH